VFSDRSLLVDLSKNSAGDGGGGGKGAERAIDHGGEGSCADAHDLVADDVVFKRKSTDLGAGGVAAGGAGGEDGGDGSDGQDSTPDHSWCAGGAGGGGEEGVVAAFPPPSPRGEAGGKAATKDKDA
jgi:hypothetical protein